MKRIFKGIVILSLTIVISDLSCKKESSVNTNYHLGEPFQIKTGEDIILTTVLPDSNDSSISVNFQRVINDSRCTKNQCYLCFGSSASILVLLTNNKVNLNITLTIPGCIDEYDCNDNLYYKVDTLGYRICLLRLDPYPETNNSIDHSIYTAKLNISKHYQSQ
jgi:hypothetical protein